MFLSLFGKKLHLPNCLAVCRQREEQVNTFVMACHCIVIIIKEKLKTEVCVKRYR